MKVGVIVKAATQAEITSKIEKLFRKNLSETGTELRLVSSGTENRFGASNVDAVARVEPAGRGRWARP